MKDKPLEELIDDLLKEQISNEDRHHLERRMLAEPEVARLVRESRETFRFLQYSRYRQIKAQLREFDAGENQDLKPPSQRKWVYVAFLILMSILVFWLWLINYYKPENLAKRNFEIISGSDISIKFQDNSEMAAWNSANELFAKGDFQNAASVFRTYSRNPEDKNYMIAQWNVLMCQLALVGPGLQWHESLDQFISIEANPLETKAKKLSELLDSIFYKFFILKPASILSALKPRLI